MVLLVSWPADRVQHQRSDRGGPVAGAERLPIERAAFPAVGAVAARVPTGADTW
jgi:hypothetical protein